MTQVWRGDEVFAVTRVKAGPCVVVQVKNKEKDGYDSVQIGYGERKEKNIKKPQRGHLEKLRIKNLELRINLKDLREFRCSAEEISKLDVGDVIAVDTFNSGDTVKVTGISKGKGFQGVVKRHGFHGQDKTHGNKDQLRMPGSIGSQAPQRVFKGVRMAGHMGSDRVTVKNLEIIDVDKENNILFIKGAVPGARKSLILVSGEGELKIAESREKAKEEIAESKNEEKMDESAPKSKEETQEKAAVSVAVAAPEAAEAKEGSKEEKKKESAGKESSEKAGDELEKKEKVLEKEDYLQKYNSLDEELRNKISEAKIMETINSFEEKYGVDLVAIVMKVLVKEVRLDELKDYFKSGFGLEEARAEELFSELKDKIFSALGG